MLRRAGACLLLVALPACLVSRPVPEVAPAEAVREMRRSFHPGGEVRRETQVLVGADGRVERDGREREFFPGGVLEAERFFEHGQPVGLWRTWFADGRPRSEVDFSGSEPATNRFWHSNGALAAQGRALRGLREGPWTYWTAEGGLLREGGYHLGLREGHWTFWEQGAKRAEGDYHAGQRVGDWTLWDEQGVGHLKHAADVVLPQLPAGTVPEEPPGPDQ